VVPAVSRLPLCDSQTRETTCVRERVNDNWALVCSLHLTTVWLSAPLCIFASHQAIKKTRSKGLEPSTLASPNSRENDVGEPRATIAPTSAPLLAIMIQDGETEVGGKLPALATQINQDYGFDGKRTPFLNHYFSIRKFWIYIVRMRDIWTPFLLLAIYYA
jgi:hypothetical protein